MECFLEQTLKRTLRGVNQNMNSFVDSCCKSSRKSACATKPACAAPRKRPSCKPRSRSCRPKPRCPMPRPRCAKPKPRCGKPKPRCAKPISRCARPKPKCSRPKPKCARPKPKCARPKPKCVKPKKSACAKQNKCSKPGPITSNGYLNFLREFREKNCGLSPHETVKRAARAWCRLTEEEKVKYELQACQVTKSCRHKRRKVCNPK